MEADQTRTINTRKICKKKSHVKSRETFKIEKYCSEDNKTTFNQTIFELLCYFSWEVELLEKFNSDRVDISGDNIILCSGKISTK